MNEDLEVTPTAPTEGSVSSEYSPPTAPVEAQEGVANEYVPPSAIRPTASEDTAIVAAGNTELMTGKAQPLSTAAPDLAVQQTRDTMARGIPNFVEKIPEMAAQRGTEAVVGEAKSLQDNVSSDVAQIKAWMYSERPEIANNISSSAVNNIAHRMNANLKLSEIRDNISMLEWTGGIGKMLVAPDAVSAKFKMTAEHFGMKEWSLKPNQFFDQWQEMVQKDPSILEAIPSFVDVMADSAYFTETDAVMFAELLLGDVVDAENDAALGTLGDFIALKGLASAFKASNAMVTAIKANPRSALSTVRSVLRKERAVPGADTTSAASTRVPIPEIETIDAGTDVKSATDLTNAASVEDFDIKRYNEIYYDLSPEERESIAGSVKKDYESRIGVEDVETTISEQGISVKTTTETIGYDRHKAFVLRDGVWQNRLTGKTATEKQSIGLDKKKIEGTTQTEFIPWDLDQVTGGYRNFNEVEGGLAIFSPNRRIGKGKGGANEQLVAGYDVRDKMGSKVLTVLDDMYGRVMAPIAKSSKSRARVSTAIQKADEWEVDGVQVGKNYTYEELTETDMAGAVLTADEANAVLGFQREVVPTLLKSLNEAEVAQDTAQGFRYYTRGEGTDATQTYKVKPFKTAQSATTGLQTTKVTTIYTPHGKNSKEMTATAFAEQADEWYAKGYKLVRTKGKHLKTANPKRKKNGDPSQVDQYYEYALVRDETLAIPHGSPIKGRPGYAPRQYKGRNFYVTMYQNGRVNGTMNDKANSRQLMSFESESDARAWLGKQTDGEGGWVPSQKERGAFVNNKGQTMKVRMANELTTGEVDDVATASAGGMFRGGRSSEALPHMDRRGRTGRKRIDPMQSVGDYLQRLSRDIPLANYRALMKRRWMNEFMSRMDSDQLAGSSFEELAAALEKLTDHPEYERMKAALDQLRMVDNNFTTGEKWVSNVMNSTASAIEGSKVGQKMPRAAKAVSSILVKTDARSVQTAVRGTVFNLMLGTFNMAQFFVNASGAIIPALANPKFAAKGMAKALAYSILDSTPVGGKNPLKAKQALNSYLAKKLGLDEMDMKLWEASGIRENITSANPDYASVLSNRPYDQSVLRRAFSKADIFFQAGELVSARSAFATATEFVKKVKGRPLTLDDLDEVVKRAEHYRLNMGQSNKAGFQRGLTSIPTQFLQVQVKYFEAITGQQFTMKERARIALGQIGVLGLGGSTIGSFLNPIISSEAVDAGLSSPEDMVLLENGVLGWMLYSGMGLDNQIVERIQFDTKIPSLFTSIVSGDVFLQPSSLAGPGGSLAGRAFSSAGRMLDALVSYPTADDMTLGDVAAIGEVFVRALADLPSSTRNLMKAQTIQTQNVFYTKAGVPVFQYLPMNTQTKLAQAMGFQNSQEASWFELSKTGAIHVEGSAGAAADVYVRLFAQLQMTDDDTKTKFIYSAISSLNSSFDRPEDALAAKKQLLERLEKPGNIYEEKAKEMIDFLDSDLQQGVSSMFKRKTVKTNPHMREYLEEFNNG